MEQKVSSSQQDSHKSYWGLSIEAHRLMDRVYDLGDLFLDMLLDEESIVHDYVMVSYGNSDSLSHISNEALDYFSYTDYSFEVLPPQCATRFFLSYPKEVVHLFKILAR